MVLTAEHEAFRRTVREFADAEIAPHVAQWDRKHHFPTDRVRKRGDLGLFGLIAPEEFERAASLFTNGYRVIRVPGGHFMHREHPEHFNRELLRVLAPMRVA